MFGRLLWLVVAVVAAVRLLLAVDGACARAHTARVVVVVTCCELHGGLEVR